MGLARDVGAGAPAVFPSSGDAVGLLAGVAMGLVAVVLIAGSEGRWTAPLFGAALVALAGAVASPIAFPLLVGAVLKSHGYVRCGEVVGVGRASARVWVRGPADGCAAAAVAYRRRLG